MCVCVCARVSTHLEISLFCLLNNCFLEKSLPCEYIRIGLYESDFTQLGKTTLTQHARLRPLSLSLSLTPTHTHTHERYDTKSNVK